ncbi:MAG: DUF4168 domain-containing protein [Leeuwenhoekiella sp.]
MRFRKNIITTMIVGLLFAGTTATIQAQETNAPQIEAAEDVSEKELKEFVMVYQNIQKQNQSAQQQMMGIIKESGLEVQRFNEIQQAKMSEDKDVNATEEELKSHEAATTELNKMQPQIEKQMKGIIEESSLTMQRYQAVATALQNDQDLQQRFQKIMLAVKTGNQ